MTDREPSEPLQIRLGEKRFAPVPQAPPEPPEPVQISLGEMRFVPAPPEPPEPPVSPKSIPWKKIGEGLAAVRTATLNGLMLVSLIALIGFAVAELSRKVVVIDPIRLPETLRERGYSEDVAADRLWDEMGRINEVTPTAKDSVAVQPTSQKMDFEPPGSGIALQEVVQMLRRVLGQKETRIVGEITCTTKECKPEGLALRLRVFRGDGMKSVPMKILPEPRNGDQTSEAEIDRDIREDGMKVIFLSPVGDQTYEAEIDRYFHEAAIELLREIDPYVVAFYLYQTNTDAAKSEALQLIARTGPHRKWALNLLGIIAADRFYHDVAIDRYRSAIAADEADQSAVSWYQRAIAAFEADKFAAIANTNWGNALVAKGDLANAMGKLVEAKDDWAKAIQKFTLATELDPENAAAYNSWGIALGRTGDLDEAIEKFILATERNPKYADAYYNWGIALDKTGDLAKAAGDLAKAAGELVEAKDEWATAKGEWAKAIEKFTLATERDHEYALAFRKKGLALSKLIKALSSADDPADAFQRYTGDAVAAFRRYAELMLNSPGKVRWADRKIIKLKKRLASATND
jgi:tetratricopeptide (TPR) repeat protein